MVEVLLAMAGAGLAITALALRRNLGKGRDLLADTESMAKQLGLSVVTSANVEDAIVLTGQVGDDQVNLAYRAGVTNRQTAVTMEPSRSVPRGLLIRPAADADKLARSLAVRSGDPSLDADVVIIGEPAEVLALLVADVRTGLANEVPLWKIHVVDGHLRMTADALLTEPMMMELLLASMKLLARLLTTGEGTTPQRLAKNATEDPLPLVRFLNLEALLEHAPEAPDIPRTVWAAMEDGHPLPRLAAAVHQLRPGDGGTRIPFPPGVAGYRTSPALAVQEVADRATAELLAALDETTAGEAEAAAMVLGAHGDACAEGALLELLAHHEGPGVRLAAADALGNLGTEQSIQTLKETADPLRSGHVLKEACKDALRRVRSRLTRET